jgi:ethanolamine ammonia-lyase small subunit
MSGSPIVARDPWEALREATAARVALGRTGAALPTAALLAFELDQARARDAVHRRLDVDPLVAHWVATGREVVRVHGAAADRATYLLRPDLGRRLDDASRERLRAVGDAGCDVLFVVADGLSAVGVQAHATALVDATIERLPDLTIGPIVVAEQARVALADEVGELLGARAVVAVIGERPGLTSPDSVGCYLTFAPRVGRHDAQRNCVSNIRPAGLAPALAAVKLAWLIRASLRLSLSGVALKDDSALIEAGPTDATVVVR